MKRQGIPHGQTRIEAGDRVLVIGRPDNIQAFSMVVAPAAISNQPEDVVILGGSDIGYHTARRLEERGLVPRLVVESEDRAQHRAELLSETVMMEHELTDVDFLVREEIDDADAVVAAATSDEQNLLVSLLASKIGVPRVVSVVESGEYAEIFEGLGINVAINPRDVTAEEIVRFARERHVENLSLVEERQAEVLEIEVDDESILTDRPIHESVADLPSDVVIGVITREQEFVVPRGNTVIESGDHVLLFVTTGARTDVMGVV